MNKIHLRPCALALAASCALTVPLVGQDDDDELIELSPFEVTADDREGYMAADTLAGNRLNTKLRDVGNAVSVITNQFLKDTGATDNQSLLQYTTGTEVGGPEGNFGGNGDGALLDESSNFINPNRNTRVRGLTEADNTRDFFTSEIPWDSYNVERVELQRGPNSILFGQGSPAGLVNVGLKGASYEDAGEVEIRFDEYGSTRYVIDLNQEIIEGELAIRASALYNDTKYKQKPAFSRDERFFLAGRWDPRGLNGDDLRTTFKFNYEDGKIQSNNPRSLAPIDRITPWFETGTYEGVYLSDGNSLVDGELVPVSKGDVREFNHLNRETFNAHQLQQDNVKYPNHGQGRPGINGGPFGGAFNPDYNPLLGNFADNFGGPINYFGNGVTSPDIWQQEIQESRGIDENGDIDTGLGFDFNRAMGIAPQSDFARSAGLPFGEFGVYKNINITDPSIYDFYNNQIDGPNKDEWQNFDAVNMSFSQTFLGDMIGFDVSYNKQNYDNGQLSLLSGSQQAIYVDMMAVFPDGTADGGLDGGIPFDDGTPNPNVGRPFISDRGQFANNSLDTERESLRVTPFARYDLEKGNGNWFTKLIGSGTFTGLYSKDTFRKEEREWQQYAILDQGYIDFQNKDGLNRFTDSFLAPSTTYYLGDSLINSTTAVGANIGRIPGKIVLPRNGITRTFDSTWAHPLDPAAAGYVDPSAVWIRNSYLPPELEYPDFDPANPLAVDGDGNLLWPDRRIQIQADNPENYVGWIDLPYEVTASEDSAANRELLGTRAGLDNKETRSEALIWQGHLLNDSIVGTYGWRKDNVTSQAFSQNDDTGDPDNGNPGPAQNFGHLIYDPSYYSFDNPDARSGEIEVQSRSYSIVAHLDQLPFLANTFEKVPFRLSFFYNNSTNFQPEAARVDLYGQSLSAPAGETIDKGILIQSKDGRYSLKMNKYTSTATTATSKALDGASFIGEAQARGANWTNQYEYDFSNDNQTHIITHMANNRPAGAAIPPNFSPDRIPVENIDWGDGDNSDQRGNLYNYSPAPGETIADAEAREAGVITAWRNWQDQVDPRLYEAWGLDLASPFRLNDPTRVTATEPQNFTVIEDSVSSGYEFEFSARPTENWNIIINAAKTKATRNNIGGEDLTQFMEAYSDVMNNTAAGDLRIWWGGAGNETALFQWNSEVGSEWIARKLQEGTNVPELREWRFNVITNYDFTEGKFSGVNVGAGVRWEDSIVIGYRPILGATDTEISFDIANPYMGPTETHLDLWAGYGRPISDKIDWRIQVNVRNAFEGDDLIPITTQPDGTPGGYRIAPSQTISLRNTFSF